MMTNLRSILTRSSLILAVMLGPITPALADTEVTVNTPAQQSKVVNGGQYTITGVVDYSYWDSRYPNNVWCTATRQFTGQIVAQGPASWGGWPGDQFTSALYTAPTFSSDTVINIIVAAEDDDTDKTVLDYGYGQFYIGP